jgi:hypothetical protein
MGSAAIYTSRHFSSIMKKKKITTIEDLAVLVQQEFLTVNEKLGWLRKEILKIRDDLEDIKLR